MVAVSRYVFGLALAVYLTTTGGSFATDLASYEVTKNLVEQRSLAMSYNVLQTEAERGVDGRYYAPVGIGHPLFGIPFYAAARAFQIITGLQLGKPESLTKAAVVMGSTVAAAGCVYLAFLFAWRIGGSLRGAVVAALGLAFGTPLWAYSKFGFNAPLAAMCLLGGAYGAWIGVRERRARALVFGGMSLGFALLTRHEMSLGALPVALWLWLESRPSWRLAVRRGLLFGVPVVIAVGLWFTYNYTRFGHPLDTGLLRDPNVRFDTPLLVGLHGLLLSPGRSLLLYAPLTAAGLVALLPLARADRSTAMLLGAFPLVFAPLYALMHQWDGGESWGPRYLVPVLSFLVLPLAPWLANGGADDLETGVKRRSGFVASLLRTSPPNRGRGKVRGNDAGGDETGWPMTTEKLRSSVLTALFAASVLVQLPGVLVDFSKAQQQYARTKEAYSIALTRYTWEGAPLVLNTRTAADAIPDNLAYLSGRRSPPDLRLAAGEETRDFSQQFAFSLDFWWLYLFYLGAVPAPLAVALGAVPLLVAMGFGLRIRRLARVQRLWM